MATGQRPANRWMIWVILAILALAASAAIVVFWVRGNRSPIDRGIAAYERGDWSEAAALARQRLEDSSADPEALRLLARASARLGRNDSAEAIYRRLGTGAMEAEDLFLLGRGLIRRGQAGPGLAALRAAWDADHDHAETLDALAEQSIRIGSIEEAAKLAAQLARQPGWEVRGQIRLAPLLRQLHDPAGGAAAITEALAIDPRLQNTRSTPAEASKLLAACLLECGRADEAGRALDTLGKSSVDPEVARLRSRILLQQRKGEEAKKAIKAAGSTGEPDPLRPEPSPFVGEKRCAACHAEQFDAHQKSRHTATLVKTADLGRLSWPAQTLADPVTPEVRHTFHASGEKVEVATEVKGRVFRAVVDYALGSNHQGQSFLARDESGKMHELRISRYPASPIWDRTNQHPERPPDDAGYLGRPLPESAAESCLNCHSTHSLAAREPQGRPEGADRGIGCERCHGPGGNHILAVGADFPELAITNWQLAKAEQVMALCGDCHRAPPGSPTDDPSIIRFQAPTLRMSRCYTESQGGLNCVTCHDPHRNAERSAAHYERVCLNCHTPASTLKDQDTAGPRRPPCPISPKADCLRCHMPKVPDAVPRAIFTDHHIRVRRDDPLKATTGSPSGH